MQTASHPVEWHHRLPANGSFVQSDPGWWLQILPILICFASKFIFFGIFYFFLDVDPKCLISLNLRWLEATNIHQPDLIFNSSCLATSIPRVEVPIVVPSQMYHPWYDLFGREQPAFTNRRVPFGSGFFQYSSQLKDVKGIPWHEKAPFRSDFRGDCQYEH